MLISFGKIKAILGLLVLGGTLNDPSLHSTSKQVLMIRVSQESSPGAGDFDTHILGFIRALQSTGTASDFYKYGRAGPNYGNTDPVLIANTSHLFFVNASDGLALMVVQGKSNDVEHNSWGWVYTRYELSGGTANVLLSDDEGETTASDGGRVFLSNQIWSSDNTDGEVIGPLPVGFTILGQFTSPPQLVSAAGVHDMLGINRWEVISADGTRIPLNLVVGQRVRLDVKLAVQVRQDH